jgi:hypothetical protein
MEDRTKNNLKIATVLIAAVVFSVAFLLVARHLGLG